MLLHPLAPKPISAMTAITGDDGDSKAMAAVPCGGLN
jgi:hypothetical protein